MFAVILGVLIGAGLACQTAVNSRLRTFLGSPFLASTVSFVVGTLFLLVLLIAGGETPWISEEVFRHEPTWVWIGGLLGATGLTINILLFPRLGSVQTAVMPLVGQMVMGMLIDHFGWLKASRHVFNHWRMLGTVLMLIGIVLAVALPELRRLGRNNSTAAPTTAGAGGGAAIWLWRLLGIVAGMLVATQVSVNGELARALQSPVHAALVSFSLGALALLVILTIKERRFGRIRQATGADKPWWIWIGGILGGIYVFAAAELAPQIGTGQTVVLSLLGLIGGSLLVDKFGLFAASKKSIAPLQIIGLLILVTGVVLIRLF